MAFICRATKKQGGACVSKGDGTSDTDCWLMNTKRGGVALLSFALSLHV